MPLCPGVLQRYDLQGIILWCCVFSWELGDGRISRALSWGDAGLEKNSLVQYQHPCCGQ